MIHNQGTQSSHRNGSKCKLSALNRSGSSSRSEMDGYRRAWTVPTAQDAAGRLLSQADGGFPGSLVSGLDSFCLKLPLI